MKKLTVKITGQYASSKSEFTGNKKQVLEFLREEARRMRRESRIVHLLPDNAHSINKELHQSKLVTIASFELYEFRLKELLELINNHGVFRYIIE